MSGTCGSVAPPCLGEADSGGPSAGTPGSRGGGQRAQATEAASRPAPARPEPAMARTSPGVHVHPCPFLSLRSPELGRWPKRDVTQPLPESAALGASVSPSYKRSLHGTFRRPSQPNFPEGPQGRGVRKAGGPHLKLVGGHGRPRPPQAVGVSITLQHSLLPQIDPHDLP